MLLKQRIYYHYEQEQDIDDSIWLDLHDHI